MGSANIVNLAREQECRAVYRFTELTFPISTPSTVTSLRVTAALHYVWSLGLDHFILQSYRLTIYQLLPIPEPYSVIAPVVGPEKLYMMMI